MMRTATRFSALRLLAVIAISLLALVNTASDVVLAWHPFSDLGITFDAAQTIVAIDRGRGGDRAGLRVGDRVDDRNTPFATRRYFVTGISTVPDGARLPLVVERNHHLVRVVVAAQIRTRTLIDNVTNEIFMFALIFTVLIGGWLLLVRPSKMTWAFFLYCAVSQGWSTFVNTYQPEWTVLPNNILWFGLNALATIPLIIFALRFPNDRAEGWRGRAQMLVLGSLVIFAPLAFYLSAGPLVVLPSYGIAATLLSALSVVGLVFVVVIFVLAYAHAPETDRAKIRWVGLGLVVGQAGPLVFSVGNSLPGLAVEFSIPLINLTGALQIAIPLSVAYVIVRHRVFDVRFVLGRAAIYGILTTLVVTAVSLVDYAAGKLVAETRLAALGDAAIAIVIGLSLNGLHKRAENVVERIFFRERRRTETRLQRVGAGLMHAESREGISNTLVAELTAALRLGSGAIFVRDGDRFERTVAVGWSETTTHVLEVGAAAVLQLSADRAPLETRDGRWPEGLLPQGERAPTFAFPVRIRDRLQAIVFLGAHAGGENLDPEERATVIRVIEAAEIALEHVEATAAIARAAKLEAENETLRALIVERVT